MFCSSCGKGNAEGASFCAHCGNRLTAAVGAAASAPAPVAAVAGVYSGFWKRFAALIVDYVILIVPSILLDSYLFGFLTYWLYFALMESSSKQATLGKMVLGIKVVDGQGRRISFVRATGRHFGKILSGLVFCIGYIMAGFTSRKQALHDLLADCLVINRDASSEQLSQRGAADSSTVLVIVLVVAVVVAIPVIGIVAAIALPAYQDYMVRSRVAEVVGIGKQAAEAVDSFVAGHNAFPSSLSEAGFKLRSEYVESIELDKKGVIRLILKVHPVEKGAITFTRSSRSPNADAPWKCAGEEIDKKYLVMECR